MRMMPPTWGAEMDSCITQRSLRPIRRPEKMKRATATVTTPMPPIWISSKITACPESGPVSHGIVNHQSGHAGGGGGGEQRIKKLAPPGVLVDQGSISSSVPQKSAAKSPE